MLANGSLLLESYYVSSSLITFQYLYLPGCLLLLIVISPSFVAGYVRAGWIGVIICLGIGCYLLQEHIRASGGFRNAFTKSNGLSNTIGIVLLFVFPVWALITLI
ncbi:putative cold-regulated 413 protein [Helianthus annuus]|nr:putative cold-regulated 413 protein [Helianthus annuus]